MKIPNNFKKYGEDFNQELRDDNLAIFSRVNESYVPIQYEVIIIKTYDSKELYPSASSWGIHGWTFNDLDAALVKFGNLMTERECNGNAD